MSANRRFTEALCYGLIGVGALSIASATVNSFAVWQLIEAADEESLGFTRAEMMQGSTLTFVAGAALVTLGLKWRRQVSAV